MNLDKLIEQLTALIKQLQDFLAIPQQPTPGTKGNLQKFCLAIRTHEGWFPGSRSQRNNNPGNCRYSSVGYLPIYGDVKRDAQNFAIFRDYATGYLYLQNLVKDKIKKNPNWNFYDFFKVYAPDEDNNDSRRYADVVAKRLEVPPTTILSTLM